MITFEHKDYIYIPVHLNLLILSNDYTLTREYIDEETMNFLKDYIKEGTDKKYILDFIYINFGDSRIFKEFTTLTSDLVLVNLSDKIKGFIEADNDDNIKFVNNAAFVGKEDRRVLEETKLLECVIENNIGSFIKKIIKNQEYYLESSNMFANKYLNVKSIFEQFDIYITAGYYLSLYIQKNYSDRKYKLICSSINGAILSNIVNKFLKKEVVNFVSLGPKISIRDKEMLNRLHFDEEYIYVGDMICTGAEIKLTQTILSLRNSNIVSGVCIAKYLNPSKELEIKTIVDVKNDTSFGYEIYPLKKENNV